MRLRPLLPCIPALALLLSPSPGAAEPPRATSAPDNRELALDLAHRGLDSYRAGRFEEAYERFREAERLFPAPTLLVHMANCQRALGKLSEAKALYEEVARAPSPEDAPPPFVEARRDAERALAEIDAELALQQKSRAAPAPSKGSIVPGALTLGFGALSLGVGALSGALALSKVDELRARCEGDDCLSADRAAADEARTLGNVSTAAFVVGGVAATAGAVLLVLRPGGESGARTGLWKDLRVSVGIGRASIELRY